METQIKQMTFGMCRNCLFREAIYSRGICKDCHDAKCDFSRRLQEQGLEPGTEEFIDKLKECGVYY